MGWALHHPFAWVGVVAGLLAWSVATLVYFAQPARRPNRRLALVLLFEGVAVGAGTGLMYMMTEVSASYAFQGIATIATLVLPILYLWFLTTIDAPIVRRLQGAATQFFIPLLAVVAAATWFAYPEKLIAGMERVWYAEWDSQSGPWQPFRLWASIAIYAFGLVVAISAYRASAPGSVARNRALAYALAFGTRDLLLGILYILRDTVPAGRGFEVFTFLARPFVTFLFIGLVAYGILTRHLFDLDVRVKWTLSRGAVAGVFVAVFFIASEATQALFEDSVGPIVGILAAGLLVFVLHPLLRWGERVAESAMPDVRPVAARSADDRRRLYEKQLEVAWSDGKLTAREVRLLDALRDRLGLTPAEGARIQMSVTRRLPARSGPEAPTRT